LPGFNDLAFLCPEVAKEWDYVKNAPLKPTQVTKGSARKVWWRCSDFPDHSWQTKVSVRTGAKKLGCPFCGGKSVLKGFNDLKSQRPNIAAQWHEDLNEGLSPDEVTVGSSLKVFWKCKEYKDHIWDAAISSRTGPRAGGCPICSGNQVLPGFNDLATLNPGLASQWDRERNGDLKPENISVGQNTKKVWWRCEKYPNHFWQAPVLNRSRGEGCSICAGKTILVGFNDLQSLFPDIAREWHPDKNGELTPSKITKGSGQKVWWSCSTCGHEWQTAVTNRTAQGQGCIECCEYGYSRKENGWFYLMRRTGEQQFGISNNLAQRLKAHAKANWELVDQVGPIDGKKVYETERILKRWLKDEIGTVPGTKENWFISDLEVQSLADLREKSGLDIEIF
jgi:hypothetical protein